MCFAYTRPDAVNAVAAIADVGSKQRLDKPVPPPRDIVLNPFRSPMQFASNYPVPCHANAYAAGWYGVCV